MQGECICCRDVKRNQENKISILETKSGSIPSAIYFFSFSSSKLHKNYQMSGEINSSICLVLIVYKSYHQLVKYGRQRYHILPDLAGLKVQISMMTSKTKIGLKMVFKP